MEISAVANILEYMIGPAEWRLADPVGALATHMGESICITLHPLHHVMAADAGERATTLGDLGR